MRKSTKVFLGLTTVALLTAGVAFLSSGFEKWEKESWGMRLKPDKPSEEPLPATRDVYVDLYDAPWWDEDLINAYPGIYWWGSKEETIWPGERMVKAGNYWTYSIPRDATHIKFNRINVADPNKTFNETVDVELSKGIESELFMITHTISSNGLNWVSKRYVDVTHYRQIKLKTSDLTIDKFNMREEDSLSFKGIIYSYDLGHNTYLEWYVSEEQSQINWSSIIQGNTNNKYLGSFQITHYYAENNYHNVFELKINETAIDTSHKVRVYFGAPLDENGNPIKIETIEFKQFYDLKRQYIY